MKKKLWPEKKYTKILKEIGKNCYEIFEPSNAFIQVLYHDQPGQFPQRFIGVCLSTCSSITINTAAVDYVCENIEISRGTDVVDWRTFRYCEYDGRPHLNAEDNIISPDKKGNIWKVSRNDVPDHYFGIATWAGLGDIAEAYHLPKV